MSECPRVGRLFGGCKFSPRFHQLPPSADVVKVLAEQQGYLLDTDIISLRTEHYVHDVCERCGKTTKSEPVNTLNGTPNIGNHKINTADHGKPKDAKNLSHY